jgi:hypothetical protein
VYHVGDLGDFSKSLVLDEKTADILSSCRKLNLGEQASGTEFCSRTFTSDRDLGGVVLLLSNLVAQSLTYPQHGSSFRTALRESLGVLVACSTVG